MTNESLNVGVSVTKCDWLLYISAYQLVPAGPWEDPRDLLEDEDDADRILPYMRHTCLRKGVKTIKQKNEEKRIREAKENARLFGCVDDQNQIIKRKVPRSRYFTRAKRKQGRRPGAYATRSTRSRTEDDGDASDNSNSRLPGDDDDEEDDEDDEEGSDSSEEINNEDDEGFAETEGGHPQTLNDNEEDSGMSTPVKKRKLASSSSHSLMEDEDSLPANSTPFKKRKFLAEGLELCSKRRLATRRKDNRRFPKKPTRWRRMRNVSPFDLSYWQK